MVWLGSAQDKGLFLKNPLCFLFFLLVNVIVENDQFDLKISRLSRTAIWGNLLGLMQDSQTERSLTSPIFMYYFPGKLSLLLPDTCVILSL